MALVVSALVINWAMISLAHMKFRKAKQQQGVTTRFPALLYPLGNWVCLIFMAAVLVIMLMTPGMAISVYLIPVWIAILGIGYLFKQKTAGTVKALIFPPHLRPVGLFRLTLSHSRLFSPYQRRYPATQNTGTRQ